MRNRITDYEDQDNRPGHDEDAQSIADVLADLLRQYSARYPDLRILIVESPPAVV